MLAISIVVSIRKIFYAQLLVYRNRAEHGRKGGLTSLGGCLVDRCSSDQPPYSHCKGPDQGVPSLMPKLPQATHPDSSAPAATAATEPAIAPHLHPAGGRKRLWVDHLFFDPAPVVPVASLAEKDEQAGSSVPWPLWA